MLKDPLPTDLQALAAFQLVTQDDGTEDDGETQDQTTANFSGLFSLSTDGGSDGEASSSLTFDLDLLGGGDGPVDSGLDSNGDTINLYQIDANTIVGSTATDAGDIDASNTVFQPGGSPVRGGRASFTASMSITAMPSSAATVTYTTAGPAR